MIKRLQPLFDAARRVMCRINWHSWVDGPGTVRICDRPGCLAAKAPIKGKWVPYTREEVTEEQVRALPRHERRRLAALARRGAFGKLT
jgi:hypothetical protein